MAKVKHRVGIDGAIDKIFSMLISNEGLCGWWASAADISAQTGGSAKLTFSDLAVLNFEYLDIQENAKVALKCVDGPGPWQDSELIFELVQAQEQVFVTLSHRNPAASDEDFLYFSTKWSCYLLSLKALVETGKGRPYPDDIKIHVGD
ncbi:SRPBCC domain-containing protein [Thalassomonas viridans]|uniref:SRPBCC domain-containing protein n=1 Tax=Thalassomonas viridans TaxID=137584 RepID=A0AAE9Z9A9_9GAMM|nr:SRPBCC domain-containing protein [Thalassomonas viridans]WDE08499.1 SRPBCC domain-containing protein [Thalassomonas viridans]